MKITTNNAVYVHKNDISYLYRSSIDVPKFILNKAFENGTFYVDDCNKYEFIKFDKPEEIEYFNDLDFIIEYSEVKDLEEKKIIDLGQNTLQEKKAITENIDSKSQEEKENIVSQLDLLDFKILSLHDILGFKLGFIKMELPEEIESKKSIRNIIKGIFNKKNK